MSFKDFPQQKAVVQLLQRSLERGRLGHAYLFVGTEMAELEAMARALAKTLICEKPPLRSTDGELPLDSCDACASCRKIETDNHPDFLGVKPEAKSRIITVEQIRDLMQTVHLRPTHARWKVAVIEAADRLNIQAANAFLKTLEEPPADSVLVLLTTDPERLLETILSRCLRLNFRGEGGPHQDSDFMHWLAHFSEMATHEQRSLLGRYRLLSLVLIRLGEMKEKIKQSLTEKSPLEKFDDLDPKLREKYEAELDAAIEAEYRRQRSDLLAGLEWWLRDIWLSTMELDEAMLRYPKLANASQVVARRITKEQATANLGQIEKTLRLLTNTNVQEALCLEVGLLQLKL